MVSPRDGSRGLSLAEMLVALSVFSTAFVILLGIFTGSAHAVKEAQEREGAIILAEQILEDQWAQPFSSLTSFTGTGTLSMANQGAQGTLAYTYALTVSDLSYSNPTKDLTVTVQWTSDNVAHQQVLETAITQ